MSDQYRFGDNGTESTRPRQSGQGDDQMNEEDSEVAHPGHGINTSKSHLQLGQFDNSPWTGLNKQQSTGFLALYLAPAMIPRLFSLLRVFWPYRLRPEAHISRR